ncbi:MAG: toprim domain-containing protein [Chitinophagaceae bacterium]|nr:toprim domain-containing protein [Chitinophagaceae bacterium]
MNIGQAKQIDLVEYLASLGYNPAKIKNEEYWYLSPLREERTASFKVDRRQNIWYDHGLGKGGTLIDFGTQYHDCSVRELLKRMHGNLSFHQPPVQPLAREESLVKIISERNLVSLSLLRYIKQRRVAEEVARKYCREIVFSLHQKTYSAIGFKNNEGGFELRNQWFKGSSSPKAITSFENGSKELSVFEGFFNFLSYQTIQQNQSLPPSNFLVLNSTSFFEKSKLLMEQHDAVHLFLDWDKAGENCTAKALSWSKKFWDESHLYKGYNDLNEWMQQIGKSQKKGLRQL